MEQYSFWLAYFINEVAFESFFEESEDFYLENSKYISLFAESQNETWIDSDLMECVYDQRLVPFHEKFCNCSYAEQWISILEEKSDTSILDKCNSIIFMPKENITNPTSAKFQENFLVYIGDITLTI